jgi:hypothetical protein
MNLYRDSNKLVRYGSSPVVNLNDHSWEDRSFWGDCVILQAGENLAVTDIVYIKNDGKTWKANANSSTTLPAIALATSAISTDAWGVFLIKGFLRDDSNITFALGDKIYVDASTAGEITPTAPSGGNFVQVLGICVHTTHTIFWSPSMTIIETM